MVKTTCVEEITRLLALAEAKASAKLVCHGMCVYDEMPAVFLLFFA